MLKTTSDHLSNRQHSYLYDLFFVLVLIAGVYFRVSGLFWGEYQFLHPDERFLTMVGTDISPVKSLGEYFDTANSSLNPHNRGHGFYVYGTLPMFITRYLVEWVLNDSGMKEMTQVGRSLSALADLLTVFLVYLAAMRLYDKRVALLAAAFAAASVLPIQQSHFFTMDTFINAFTFLAFYFAVRVSMVQNAWQLGMAEKENNHEDQVSKFLSQGAQYLRHPLFVPSLCFGIALGMAVASKLNAAPVAITLPVAMVIQLLRCPAEEREKRGLQTFLYLSMAAVVSLLVFRIFQPYAFSGPGFFGIKPNPQWVANIRELRAQSSGDVDFPPAMQWARRPIWFSFQNMVLWGLGLPLGALAWAGFLWVGWRILAGWKKYPGEWQRHGLIWVWTALYFTWQSLVRNPTMRYQLPIYPTLAIFAAWAIVALYDRRRAVPRNSESENSSSVPSLWHRGLAIVVGGIVLAGTYAYAYAFSRIYTRPITRVEASRWIYQNIPSAITLAIQTEQGSYNQPLAYPYDLAITPGSPLAVRFVPKVSGALSEVILPHVVDQQTNGGVRHLTLEIYEEANADALASARLSDRLDPIDDPRGKSYRLPVSPEIQLDPSRTYALRLELEGEAVPPVEIGAIALGIQPTQEPTTEVVIQPLSPLSLDVLPNAVRVREFQATADGLLNQIFLSNVSAPGGFEPKSLTLTNKRVGELAETFPSSLSVNVDPTGSGYQLILQQPLALVRGETYSLSLEVPPKGGAILLSGMSVANEGEWDDGLPLRIDGYDGFAGIYPQGLDFNMYWDDNPDKLERFMRILNQADYILISSNRQWGTLPRIPERFPMTTVYYRNLLGCPPEKDIVYCYRVAQPGMFSGKLGFELVKTFQSDPRLGPLRLNDQFAEEAFTVYDHPKVLIFKKTGAYDPEQVRAILGAVDFSQVLRIPPMRVGSQPANLMLPDYRWAEQQKGGTWSELFDVNALQNRHPLLSVLIWYLSVTLLGMMVYPLLRLALPGLADHGYPAARVAGMLLLSYWVWLVGSFRIPFTRTTISIVLTAILLLGLCLVYWQRKEIFSEVRQNRRYFLAVEAFSLAFFIIFLLIRLGNPDLWHPWKGGEKPMDFSYFNAVLKSTSFPPYDPWYAGGYLNYYYYGFVLVGVLVKWLGIVPSIAYNLILPTLFSMIAMGAFSLAWNLAHQVKAQTSRSGEGESSGLSLDLSHLIPALAGALGMAVLGNLGTVRMIFQGYQKIVAPQEVLDGANLFMRWLFALRGFVETLKGAHLPYSLGDWYWIPSRVIPAPGDVEPITEFPFFTVLYADPHAHLYALPLALLGISTLVSFLLARGQWKQWLAGLAWFFLAGLAVGSLRPTNTWDFYTYLILGIIVILYTLGKYFRPSARLHQALPSFEDIPNPLLRILATLGGALLFVGLAYTLFQPYAQWYTLGYTKVNLWKGTHTPLSAYLTHWGLFLFIVLSWMAWETRDWLAKTPVSAMRKLKPYRFYIQTAILTLLVVIGGLFWLEVHIGWFVLPLAAWAGVLILRPNLPDSKRFVLFLIGTGLVLTLVVETVVLVGDIGRMNTVFKFYLQVWTMFAICAAAGLGWLLKELPLWLPAWRKAWQAGLVVLVAGAALYPLMASMAKIEDRMEPRAPLSLDGMAFMPYASYTDEWGSMDLSEDYEAIRWMQQNVKGSPVIVEANLRNLYRWGSRFTIYTGLPGVVGWEWHQQQQRAVVPSAWVSKRITEIDSFYMTTDWQRAMDFLRKYNVRYIILGQQERGHYPGPGLDKFEAANGTLWREVYRKGSTVIYEVISAED